MIFSPVSELFILFFLSTPFWHLLMVSREAKHSLKQTTVLTTVAMIWCLLAFGVVKYRIDSYVLGPDFPARPLLYLFLASAVAFKARHWILGQGVSQHLLIGLQLIRPIGMLFVIEHSQGNLPAIFAYPAGLGDLLTGLLAAFVLFRFHGKKIPPFWVLLVAVVGLMDFVSAFFFGFTSSETPVQLFSFENPNQVTEYPLGLIPLFLVPYAVISHILSLTQLNRDRQLEAKSDQRR